MNFKLGLCQIAGSVDKEEAKKNAEKHVRQAAENGAQVIALPEDPFRNWMETRCITHPSVSTGTGI